jgi:hypothetical protein
MTANHSSGLSTTTWCIARILLSCCSSFSRATLQTISGGGHSGEFIVLRCAAPRFARPRVVTTPLFAQCPYVAGTHDDWFWYRHHAS